MKKQLKRVRHSLFSAKTPRTKRKYREEDKEIREKIAAELEKNGWATHSARELSAWDPFNQNAIAGYFEPDWMFGEAGFHIVIGNPPYQRIQGIQQTNPKAAAYYKKHYDAATGSFDLYVIFMERGMQLIRADGILNFINPDKWVNASFGKGLREFAVQNRNVHKLISFGAHQIFSACTYSSLLWMGTKRASSIKYIQVAPDESKAASLDDELAEITPSSFTSISYDTLSDEPWILAAGSSGNVITAIQAHQRTTGTIFSKMFQGIASSKDSVYFLKDAQKHGDTWSAYSPELEETIEIEAGFVRPLLLGDQVHRYESIRSSNLVVAEDTEQLAGGDGERLRGEGAEGGLER